MWARGVERGTPKFWCLEKRHLKINLFELQLVDFAFADTRWYEPGWWKSKSKSKTCCLQVTFVLGAKPRHALRSPYVLNYVDIHRCWCKEMLFCGFLWAVAQATICVGRSSQILGFSWTEFPRKSWDTLRQADTGNTFLKAAPLYKCTITIVCQAVYALTSFWKRCVYNEKGTWEWWEVNFWIHQRLPSKAHRNAVSAIRLTWATEFWNVPDLT